MRKAEKEFEMQISLKLANTRTIPWILQIEKQSFEYPWPIDEFEKCRERPKKYKIIAAFNKKEVVGYFVCKLLKKKILLLSIAVKPSKRRRRVGFQMVCKLIERLSPRQKTKIVLNVRETNLSAISFFKQCGFRATRILREYYRNFNESISEDAFKMAYRYGDNGHFLKLPQKIIRHLG